MHQCNIPMHHCNSSIMRRRRGRAWRAVPLGTTWCSWRAAGRSSCSGSWPAPAPWSASATRCFHCSRIYIFMLPNVCWSCQLLRPGALPQSNVWFMPKCDAALLAEISAHAATSASVDRMHLLPFPPHTRHLRRHSWCWTVALPIACSTCKWPTPKMMNA